MKSARRSGPRLSAFGLQVAAPMRAARRIGLQLLLLLLAVTTLRAASLRVEIFNSDEAYIAVQAQVLDRGGALYIDIADRKPPLVQVIYALVFALVGKSSLVAVHVFAIFVVSMTALVLGALARRFFGEQTARCAMAIFVLADAAYLPAETFAANFELFMMLPLTAALFYAGRGTRASDFVVGVLVGIAFLCKQCALAALVPIVYATIVLDRRWWTSLVSIGVGLALPISVACIAFGARELFFWTTSTMPVYLSLDGGLACGLWRGVWVTGSFLLAHCGLVWLVWRAREERSAGAYIVWIWLGASALSACAGLRFFGHYYEQLVAPASLLGACAFVSLRTELRPRVAASLIVPALGFAALAFYGREVHAMPDYERVAAYVRAHTRSEDRIEIWGHYPEVYWAAARAPAARIVHSGFLTGASGGRDANFTPVHDIERRLWAQFFDDLTAHPPRLFLDTSPARLRDYECYPVTRYPELAAWLASRYEHVADVDGVAVYAMKSNLF